MSDVTRATYTVAEAAAILGVSYWTIRDQVHKGLIPRVPYTGRRIVLARRVIDAMANGEPIPTTTGAGPAATEAGS